ncbi:hypothetical protein [Aquabacterium humicola]|uniref:hypothetical protein n=1 Tax=Aquabacterium humicola TaxID=3237377 RepID=UPI002542B39A|nr:hypothetical protein [Rubrivivax pictus]
MRLPTLACLRHAAVAAALLASALAAPAQTAATETWRLQAALPSPWGAPLGTGLPAGARLHLAARSVDGPAPLRCTGARHQFIRQPAEGLFEGRLPAPAAAAAAGLGLPAGGGITQRITCANGSFDLHHDGAGRAWLGLDGRVLVWQRDTVAATPEASVQALLLQHFAGNMAWTPAAIDARSPWLARAFTDRLRLWLDEAGRADEPPAFDGDPFTDSQEAPEAFTLLPAQVRGDRAEVPVRYSGPGPARWQVTLLLRRIDGRWLVDGTRLRDGTPLASLLPTR